MKSIKVAMVMACAAAGIVCAQNPLMAKTVITYTSWTSTTNFQVEKEIIQEFERLNPDIEVRPSDIDYRFYIDKLLTMTVAGKAPDVMRIEVGSAYVGGFFRAGSFLPLNSLIKADGVDMGAYLPAQVENFTYGGKVLAMPVSVNVSVIFYNTQMVSETGLPDLAANYSVKSWTRLAWIQAAQKLTRDLNGDGKVDVWGCGDTPVGGVGRLVEKAGGAFYTPDGSRSAINSAEALDAFQTANSMRKELRCWDPSASGNYVWDKRSAMMHMSGWGLISAQAKKVDIGIVPSFTDKRHTTMLDAGDGVSIGINSKNKAAAWRLAKFMSGEWAAVYGARLGTVTPAHVKGAYKGYAENSSAVKHTQYLVDAAIDTTPNLPKLLRNATSIAAAVDKLMTDFVVGKKGPKETIAAVESATNRLLGAK